jgi:hypothetical protein
MRKSERGLSSLWLDYGQAAAERKLLRNISAVVTAGPFLWTASDEGRTIECLEPHDGGFRLRQQVPLDSLFASFPGQDRGDEADIESLAVSSKRLWISGSHCRVRRKSRDARRIDARFRARASRCLLGVVELRQNGGAVAPGSALPFKGAGSLRAILATNPYVAPFVDLPSKENGLDIEGLCVSGKRVFLGLRGPLVDSIAIAIEFDTVRHAVIKRTKSFTHLIDLGGLGIRELAPFERDIIVLAGPVSAANGPFKLLHWRPRMTKLVQHPGVLWEWPMGTEHPEGICRLDRDRRPGFLVVYDAAADARIDKSRYRADWIPFALLGR